MGRIKKVMVLNASRIPENQQRFTSFFRDKYYSGIEVESYSLDTIPSNSADFSHLIISGSELSVVSGSIWDEKIHRLTGAFVNEDKCILGICYGHQVLSYHFCGESGVRRAGKAQFGFRKIHWSENSFYNPAGEFYAMVAHFDEVKHLDDRFEIICTDAEGVIHGFHVKNKRIWGLQFHPEYDYFAGLASWERKIRYHKDWQKYYCNEVPDYQTMSYNRDIFRAFLNV